MNFARLCLKLFGWMVEGELPDVPQSLILMAPHTAYRDAIVGRLALWCFPRNIKLMVAYEYFFFPMNILLKIMNGTPVGGLKGHNAILEAVQFFKDNPKADLLICPEGQLAATDHWNPGFYLIAKKANVPIVVGYLDYKKKVAGIKTVITDLQDRDTVMAKIAQSYEGITAKHPENFLVPKVISNQKELTKKKVALVLASGSARGLAHIGAIRELEARGYEITSIAGCSMGALVAGMYAAGKLDEFEQWMKTITVKKMFALADPSLSNNSFLKGEKIISALKEVTPDVNIEDLRIPYAAVATDIISGKEVVFESGSLYNAIRASISLPIFFRPIEANDTTLIDGGILNPLPLDRVKRNEGDILVSVNVSAPYADAVDRHKLADNYISMINTMSDLMIQRNCELMEKFYKPDVSMSLGMGSYSSFDFNKSEDIVAEGRRLMAQSLDKYERAELQKRRAEARAKENETANKEPESGLKKLFFRVLGIKKKNNE